MRSELLNSFAVDIEHEFGTLDRPIPFQPDARWKQVHGIQIVECKNRGEILGDCDAIWTRTRNLSIGVRTADCIPILLFNPESQIIGAIHAGWRGIEKGIIHSFFDSVSESSLNWIACIGPCIRECCFEVGEDLAQQFKEKFSNLDPSKVVPRFRRIDLQYIAKEQLLQEKVERIETIEECTYCSKINDRAQFQSYRREGSGNRQTSVIRIN